jgi:hypothetical protein
MSFPGSVEDAEGQSHQQGRIVNQGWASSETYGGGASEEIVFARSPRKRRVALVECGSFKKEFGLKREMLEQPYRDIRALALLLKRDFAGSTQ